MSRVLSREQAAQIRSRIPHIDTNGAGGTKPARIYKGEPKPKLVPFPGLQMVDVAAPELVEIYISRERDTVWVNINGVCALRICRIKKLDLCR